MADNEQKPNRSELHPTIPVAEEHLEVERRTVEGTRVVLTKKVHEKMTPLDIPLLGEEYEVRRVTVGKVVPGPQPVRQEGDELVIPLHEEVVVTEKKLMVREELRVVRRRVERHEHREETVRTETVEVERRPPRKP